MTDHATGENRFLDDQLAEFTDQVVSTRSPEEIPLTEDEYMRDLKNTILKIQESVVEGELGGRKASRIKANVLSEFADEFGGARQKSTAQTRLSRLLRPREKTWQSTASRNRGLVLRIAAVAVAIILALIPFTTNDQIDLPATALGEISFIPILLVVIAACVAAYFLFRRK